MSKEVEFLQKYLGEIILAEDAIVAMKAAINERYSIMEKAGFSKKVLKRMWTNHLRCAKIRHPDEKTAVRTRMLKDITEMYQSSQMEVLRENIGKTDQEELEVQAADAAVDDVLEREADRNARDVWKDGEAGLDPDAPSQPADPRKTEAEGFTDPETGITYPTLEMLTEVVEKRNAEPQGSYTVEGDDGPKPPKMGGDDPLEGHPEAPAHVKPHPEGFLDGSKEAESEDHVDRETGEITEREISQGDDHHRSDSEPADDASAMPAIPSFLKRAPAPDRDNAEDVEVVERDPETGQKWTT